MMNNHSDVSHRGDATLFPNSVTCPSGANPDAGMTPKPSDSLEKLLRWTSWREHDLNETEGRASIFITQSPARNICTCQPGTRPRWAIPSLHREPQGHPANNEMVVPWMAVCVYVWEVYKPTKINGPNERTNGSAVEIPAGRAETPWWIVVVPHPAN